MAWQFAIRLALIAFGTSCARGVLAGSAFAAAMKTALISGAVFYCIGLITGEIARRAVEESVEAEFAASTAPPETEKTAGEAA